jgi:FKBP-type peptidyl-prolyl cis-trans isomerase
MTLKSISILGLSSILLACGGSENTEENETNNNDSLELATQFNAAADITPNTTAPAAVFDTVVATGVLIDDLSFMHGIAFAQRLMRERITFIDAAKLGAVFLEFENGTKTATEPADASNKLRELSKTTQNFQQINPTQKAEATDAFASLVYVAELKYKGLKTIDAKKFVDGLNGYVKNKVIPSAELIKMYTNAIKGYEDKMVAERNEKTLAEGKAKAPDQYAFLAKKEKEAGVKKTASGLLYEVITAGSGAKPNPSNKVKVHYEGSTIDGKVFDSSYTRGEPIEFGLGQVIKGWTEGLQLMSPGSKYKLYIPQDLGYGTRGSGEKIPPYATLIFTVELISFQ